MITFLATLGQRPEAITIAFDRLRERYTYDQVAIIHTNPLVSGIRESLTDFQMAMDTNFPAVRAVYHEVSYQDGSALIDLTNTISAQAYFESVLDILMSYRQAGHHLHLLVAGGRKAMSIYALLAAARVFDPPADRVWTVLSPPELVGQVGTYRIPPGQRDNIQLVDLPLLPARLSPGLDPHHIRPRSRAEAFCKKLTPQELNLVTLLIQHPYASNDMLGSLLNKSSKTIENQFRSIYAKLVGFLEEGEAIPESARRIALLDVVRQNA